jgi:histidyl-tRNA synthetase
VGISIGLTRLFWQLREAGLIEGIGESSVQAMVALMDEAAMPHSLDIARRLRAGGINTEVQMEPKKVGKQFQYAAKAGIRFVVLAGEDELARGVVAVKDLLREQQFEVAREELASALQVELEQTRAMAR